MKKKPPKIKRKMMAFRFRPEVVEMIKTKAAEEHRTVTAFMEWAIMVYVKRYSPGSAEEQPGAKGSRE